MLRNNWILMLNISPRTRVTYHRNSPKVILVRSMINSIEYEKEGSIKSPSKQLDFWCDWNNWLASRTTSRRMAIRKNVEVRMKDASMKINEPFLEYEQDIVEWVDETKVSLCPSCAKTFGFSRRKHHCRLDGYVICNQCSQFLPFSMARKSTRRRGTAIHSFLWCRLGYLIEPNTSSSSSRVTSHGVTLQRSNSLTSLASTTTPDDSRDGGGPVDYLRICLSCRQILQRRYNHISFKNSEKDEIFLHYEVREGVCSYTVIGSYRLENCRSTQRTFQRSSHVFGNCGLSPVSKSIG